MPTPTIPKRTRSLGARICAAANSGGDSRKVAAAKLTPAAPMVVCRNCRRETRSFLFMVKILCPGRPDGVAGKYYMEHAPSNYFRIAMTAARQAALADWSGNLCNDSAVAMGPGRDL